MKTIWFIILGALIIASVAGNTVMYFKYQNKNTTTVYSQAKNSIFSDDCTMFGTSKCQSYYDAAYDFGFKYPIDRTVTVEAPGFDAVWRSVDVNNVLNVQLTAPSSPNDYEQSFLNLYYTTPASEKSITHTASKYGNITAYSFVTKLTNGYTPNPEPQAIVFGKDYTFSFMYNAANAAVAQQVISTLQANL